MRWYQRPITAVAAGVVLAAGIASLVTSLAIQSYGQAGAFAMIVLGPLMPGFIVGLMVKKDGDIKSAISACLFAAGMAAYIAWIGDSIGAHEGYFILFMMGLGLGVPAVAVAAVFGKLGEMTSTLAPRTRGIVAVLVILALGGGPVGYWLNVQWELLQFKRIVLPSIQQRFSQHVLKLPDDSKWTIDEARFPARKQHVISASAPLLGQKILVKASASGSRLIYCRCTYEPAKPVQIAGRKAIQDYLKKVGAPDEIIRRLKYFHRSGVLARAWYCPNSLLPDSPVKPCGQKPACGSDLSFALLNGGTIRMGYWYYKG